MKNFFFISYCAVFFCSCGTIGHVQFYSFSEPKLEIENKLHNIIDSSYSVPGKWANIYQESGPLELIYVYFQRDPEEVYQIGFTGEQKDWESSSNCKLSLDGVFNGRNWTFRKDLSSSDMSRIRERFEKEILSKIKIQYFKGD